LDEVTLSLGALTAFAAIVANAVALREGVRRNRERHDKRDLFDQEIQRLVERNAQRWRDYDTEARVRNEINDRETPIDAMSTREWPR